MQHEDLIRACAMVRKIEALETDMDELLEPHRAAMVARISAATTQEQLQAIREELTRDWPRGFHRSELRTACNAQEVRLNRSK